MKKINRFISLLLLFAVVVSSAVWISSCGKIEASSTISKIFENMDKLDSYRSITRMSMSFYSYDENVQVVSESMMVEANRNAPDDYFFYRESTNTTECEALNISESFSKTEAYDGEKYYIKSVNRGKQNKIYGSMEMDEFFDYMYRTGGFEMDLSGCKNMTQRKNADGSGNIECSGFSKRVINDITNLLGIGSGELGADVSDVKVYITYDNEYRAQKMDYIFVFNIEKNQKKHPTLRISFEYSDHNSAEDDPNLVTPTGYKEIEHFNVFFELEEFINGLVDDKKGGFVSHTVLNARAGIQRYSFTETDTVTFKERFGKFRFNVNININDVGYAMQYKKGKLKTKGPDINESEESSDAIAMNYITSLADNAKCNISNLNGIRKVEDGLYYIVYNIVDSAIYDQMFAQYGGDFHSGTHTITVTIVEDEIKIVESSIRIKGDGDAYLNVDTTNTFD